MSKHGKSFACLSGSIAVAAIGAVSLTASPAGAACQGPGAPASGHTRCVTAIAIPGNPLQSFDISWVDPKTSRYYLSDRANAAIDIIDTRTLHFVGMLPGFVGIVIKNGANGETTYLRDVARLELGPDNYALRSMLDGGPAVAIPVFQLPGANALQLSSVAES